MPTETPTPMQLLMGGSVIEARFVDGATQSIQVALLRVKDYPRFAAALQDEVAQIAVYTGLTPERAADLHPESHEEIIKVGAQLNLDFFARWVSRRQEAQKKVTPQAQAQAERLLREVVGEQIKNQLSVLFGQAGASSSAAPTPQSSPAEA